ncbi:hypothetical protein [Mycolicibacterium brisbanense]|nr:hypothetical protein [Mycolicibacterium brisbanense]
MSVFGFFLLFFIGLFPVLIPATTSTIRAISGWRGRRAAATASA